MLVTRDYMQGTHRAVATYNNRKVWYGFGVTNDIAGNVFTYSKSVRLSIITNNTNAYSKYAKYTLTNKLGIICSLIFLTCLRCSTLIF